MYENQEIVKALEKFAASDMRKARKEGSIMIAQTKRGTVELTYNPLNRSYRVGLMNGETFPGGHIAIKNMAASGCSLLLQSLYAVEIG